MKINEQSPTQWRMPREVTEKSSYLNRTGSVFYIGRNCEDFLYWLSNLGRCCSSIVKKVKITTLKLFYHMACLSSRGWL